MNANLKLCLMLLVFILSAWPINPCFSMEPDEEAKRDPVFLAQYGCVPEYFLVEKHFKNEAWKATLKVIEDLEKERPVDRYLTTMKSRVFARMGNYKQALKGFNEALQQTYQCKLVSPRLTFAAVPSIADQAILWFNIYETYEGLGNPQQATDAYHKAKTLLREAIEVESDEKFESVAARVFYAYSIFRNSFE